MHQNINGLVNKSDMLSVCLDELATDGMKVDILCITEHNMRKGDEDYLQIPNFVLGSYFMRGSRHGGSCILIKNGLRFRGLDDINKMSIISIIECSAIELTDHKILYFVYLQTAEQNNRINKYFLFNFE